MQEWFHENKILRIHEKPYIIIKELGFGGSSKVYEALDPFSKAIKAIKQVNIFKVYILVFAIENALKKFCRSCQFSVYLL